MRKSDSPSKPNLLYSAKDLKAGIVTDPVGEYLVGEDGKTKIKFYKKGGYRSKTNRKLSNRKSRKYKSI